MKKILLGLGTLITIVVPLTEIISCGSHNFKDGEDFKKINLNSRMNKKEYEKAVKPFIDPIISLDKLEAKAGANDATEIDKKNYQDAISNLGIFLLSIDDYSLLVDNEKIYRRQTDKEFNDKFIVLMKKWVVSIGLLNHSFSYINKWR